MMFNKIHAFRFAILVSALVFLHHPTGTAEDVSRQAVVDAIDQGAEYACRALLDENGKSRCDYYPLEGRWSDYEPAWHTGQLVYALVRAYDITGKTQYLEAARKAGNWWISLEIQDPPRLKGMVKAVHMAGIDYIVFATVTDGAAGLFRLYEATGDRRYADVPTRAGQWMLEHMYEPRSRMFYDAVDPASGEVMKDWSPFWPGKKEQTLNDVARPNNEGSLFKEMYKYTKNPAYKKLFIDLCESLVEKQGPEGIWMEFTPNNKQDGSFHPRFNIWYAESLLEGFDLTGDKRFLSAALKTGIFYTKYQQKNGAFFYKNNLNGSSDVFSISGSTVAFAGILWQRLSKNFPDGSFQENIRRSLNWILENRYPKDHPDRNLAGGFFEIQQKSGGGKLRIYQRDIATSFCIRFLCDYVENLSKQKSSTP